MEIESMDYQKSIAIKLEHAKEYEEKTMQCSKNYFDTKNEKHLVSLGSYVGTFATNLRSALNYMIADYCQRRNFRKNKRGKKLSTDFPYGYSESEFKNLDLSEIISNSDPNIFALLERCQPYYPDHLWLGHLMKLSNKDKHEIVVTVEDFNISAMAALNGMEIHHLGKKIVVARPAQEPVAITTPCYFDPFFALADGTFKALSIKLDEYAGTFVPAYVQKVPSRVKLIVDEFYKRLEANE